MTALPATPAFSSLMGVVAFAASSAGGQPGWGAGFFGIMFVFGLGILLAGRSETIRGLRGDGRDERFAQLDLQATMFSGVVVIIAIIGVFLNEIAHGRDGMQYGWLGAIAGLAYILAVVLLRLRS